MAVIISRRSSYCPNFATAPLESCGSGLVVNSHDVAVGVTEAERQPQRAVHDLYRSARAVYAWRGRLQEEI